MILKICFRNYSFRGNLAFYPRPSVILVSFLFFPFFVSFEGKLFYYLKTIESILNAIVNSIFNQSLFPFRFE
jgi:hypothetical protein